MEKRAKNRWEETNHDLERDNVKNCQRENLIGWDPLIFELFDAPPFVCGEPIPPTLF